MNKIDDLLNNHRVVVCAGSGGVGKTTMSAALAVRAAELGKRVLVLTIDPAKRLSQALGLEAQPWEDTRVPGQTYKGEIWAAVVDSQKVFDQFVTEHITDSEERTRVLKNRLYNQLSTTLSGSQEYTALERLLQAYRLQLDNKNKYDLIILDTPPAQHAVEFLRAPQKMYSLFQSSIVKWFLPKASAGGLFGLLDRSTKLVFQAMESLTGSGFLEELREFFLVIRSLREVIQEHSAEIHRILTGVQTTFVVVTSFDEIKVQEAEQFQKLLRVSGYNLSMVIINRAFPEWLSEVDTEPETQTQQENSNQLLAYYNKLQKYYLKQSQAFKNFEVKNAGQFDVIRVPDFDQDVQDLKSVEHISEEVVQRG